MLNVKTKSLFLSVFIFDIYRFPFDTYIWPCQQYVELYHKLLVAEKELDTQSNENNQIFKVVQIEISNENFELMNIQWEKPNRITGTISNYLVQICLYFSHVAFSKACIRNGQ